MIVDRDRIILQYKKLAAEVRAPVYRWYAKFIHAEMIVEICLFSDLDEEMRGGWRAFKPELKALGFSMVDENKDGEFLLFCNAEQARVFRDKEHVLKNE